MKMMKNFVAKVLRVWRSSVVKYGLIAATGITLVGFVGDNSLMAHMRNVHHINELAEEIDEYNNRAREDMRKIRELNRNPKAIERIARERYFMKHDDEDIFVLSDDERETQTTGNYYEAAQ